MWAAHVVLGLMRFTRWSETFRPVCERMWVLLWHQIWTSSDLSQLLFSDGLSACSAIDYRNILAGSCFVFIWQKMCGGRGARGQGDGPALTPSLSFQSKQQEEVVNHSNVLSRNSDQQGEQRTHTHSHTCTHTHTHKHTTYGVSLQSSQRRFNQWKRANDTRSPITASHRKHTYHTSFLYIDNFHMLLLPLVLIDHVFSYLFFKNFQYKL